MARRIIIVLISVLAASCTLGSQPAPPEDIDKAAGLFFERLKNAEYDLIYNDSVRPFKNTKLRPEVVDNLKQAVSIGKPREYTRISMTFDKYDGKPIASAVYSVLLDQGNADYTLTFMDDGGEWKLFGFAVKPRGVTPQPS